MKEYKTDFEFKGNRNYVHSTTLVEELSKLVYENNYPEKEWEMPKVDAQFRKQIPSNGKYQIFEGGMPASDNAVVSASFKFYDKQHKIAALFVGDEGRPVVKRIKTNYSVEEMIMEGDFSGSCKIPCPNRVAFTENIIEANKRIHLMTLRDKGRDLKVINLYMKKFPVYHGLENHPDLLMKIKNISFRSRGKSVATLNSFSFPQLAMDPFEIAYIVEGL